MATSTDTTPAAPRGIDPQLAFQVLPAVGTLPPFTLGGVARKPDESPIIALAKAWKVEHARGRLAIAEAGDDTDDLVDAIDARLKAIEQAMASVEPCDGADVAALLDTAIALVDSMRGCLRDSDVTDDRLRPLIVAARRGAHNLDRFLPPAGEPSYRDVLAERVKKAGRKPLAQVLDELARNTAAEEDARLERVRNREDSRYPTEYEALRVVQARLGDLPRRVEVISDPKHLLAVIEGMNLAAETLHTPIGMCVGEAKVIGTHHVAATMLSDLQEFLDHICYTAEERLHALHEETLASEALISRAVRRESWAEARRLIAEMEAGHAPVAR
ncbi:hypothetical protein ACTZWW_03170 [Salinarimonas sp. NSM]|uniref:hypothetical protein n=1 Tax=Salinarimonas sp. NSM TaxID=3458003 RepID=UPI0040352B52